MKKLPPFAEWDFRSITADDVPRATIYEYTRSTHVLRARIELWLETKLNGSTIRKRLKAVAKSAGGHPFFRHLLAVDRQVALEGLNLGIPDVVLEVVAGTPDFPRPWIKCGHSKADIDSSILCRPMTDRLTKARARCPDDPLGLLEKMVSDSYELRIHWQHSSAKKILSDFERWLRQESKRHSLKKRGAAAQVPTWKLKELATWRLKNAGLSYNDAHHYLPSIDPDHKEWDRSTFPIYSEESDWNKAVQSAAAEIERTENLY